MLGPASIAVVAVQWFAQNCIEMQGGALVYTCDGGHPPTPAGQEWWKYDNTDTATGPNGHNETTELLWQWVNVNLGPGKGCIDGHPHTTCFTGYVPSMVSDGGAMVFTNMGAAPAQPGTGTTRPMTVDEALGKMEAQPVPEPVLRALPDGVPVELPVLNPTDGDTPQPSPLKIPVGAPVPVPNSNPQTYDQGYALITPHPTSGEPFRVDVLPGDDIGTDPQGMPEDGTKVTPPAVEKPASAPSSDPPPDICKDHPDASACAKLDVPSTPAMSTQEVNVAMSPDSGWGADNGTCPAMIYTHLVGSVDVYQLFCKYLQGVRFLVIGFGWLMGTLIFIGRVE